MPDIAPRERIIPPPSADLGEVERSPVVCWWGQSSHTHEYTVFLRVQPGRFIEDIPARTEQQLQDLLGDDWVVSNRGSRLEVFSNPIGHSDHQLIRAILESAFDLETGQTE